MTNEVILRDNRDWIISLEEAADDGVRLRVPGADEKHIRTGGKLTPKSELYNRSTIRYSNQNPLITNNP